MEFWKGEGVNALEWIKCPTCPEGEGGRARVQVGRAGCQELDSGHGGRAYPDRPNRSFNPSFGRHWTISRTPSLDRKIFYEFIPCSSPTLPLSFLRFTLESKKCRSAL
ncbi:hypothetical protein TNCV_52181 [Trichonephila clavipes]|nr:hypothetical protein TNCV_52181 [Trichonephila clavipes]